MSKTHKSTKTSGCSKPLELVFWALSPWCSLATHRSNLFIVVSASSASGLRRHASFILADSITGNPFSMAFGGTCLSAFFLREVKEKLKNAGLAEFAYGESLVRPTIQYVGLQRPYPVTEFHRSKNCRVVPIYAPASSGEVDVLPELCSNKRSGGVPHVMAANSGRRESQNT